MENSKELYKNIFPYTEVPRTEFKGEVMSMDLQEEIWVTDTTFRDGQQSMSSFGVDNISKIFDYIHKIDNNSGIIRQSEFFLYTESDRKAVETCQNKGYEFPEITAWIRATEGDLKLVKDMGIKETGMLMSCSDYHIFDKLNMNRKEAFKHYLNIASKSIEEGIVPRCHLEDITRADFHGFVIPLVKELMKMSEESGIEVKIRACDTLGLGVPYNGVDTPRGVAAIISGLKKYGKVPSKSMEWHGHNDFYNVVTNSATAWLYGCSGINATIFGIGERTGNCPIEAMIVEYGQLKGNMKNVELRYISELAEFFKKNLNYEVSDKTPFVGSDFNVTKAGIHADGLLKNEEIYNAFDTRKILGRPPLVAVNQYSGIAGIAVWVNGYFNLEENEKLDKRDERLVPIKDWVDKEYDNGRTTVIRNDELKKLALKNIEGLEI